MGERQRQPPGIDEQISTWMAQHGRFPLYTTAIVSGLLTGRGQPLNGYARRRSTELGAELSPAIHRHELPHRPSESPARQPRAAEYFPYVVYTRSSLCIPDHGSLDHRQAERGGPRLSESASPCLRAATTCPRMGRFRAHWKHDVPFLSAVCETSWAKRRDWALGVASHRPAARTR